MSRSGSTEGSEDEGSSQSDNVSEASVIGVNANPAIETVEAHEEVTSASEAVTNTASSQGRLDTIEIRLSPVSRPQDYQQSPADLSDNFQEHQEGTPHDDAVDEVLSEIHHKGATLYKVQFADGRRQEVVSNFLIS